MKHRIIRCTQGLFGSQSLLYSVSVFSQKVPLYIPTSSGSLKLVCCPYILQGALIRRMPACDDVSFSDSPVFPVGLVVRTRSRTIPIAHNAREKEYNGGEGCLSWIRDKTERVVS